MRTRRAAAALAGAAFVSVAVLAAAPPATAASSHERSISQAVGQPDRFGLGLGRYDTFRPDPRHHKG